MRQEDYCRPRPLSEAYSVPPAARPVTRTFPDYSSPPPLPQPNNTFALLTDENSYNSNSTLNASSMELPLQGYMQMNHAGSMAPTIDHDFSRAFWCQDLTIFFKRKKLNIEKLFEKTKQKLREFQFCYS